MALLFPGLVSARSEFTPLLQSALSETLKLKTANGRKLAAQALAQDKKNLCALLVSNYPDCLQLLLTDDAGQYDQLMRQQEKRLSEIKSISEKTPYKRYAEAETNLQIGFCKLKSGSELQAALNFRKAYTLLVENQKHYPNFAPNLKSLGLLHVLIGSVPQKYQWLLNTFGFYDSLAQGRHELRQAAELHHPFRTEAAIMEALVNEYLTKEAAQSAAFFEQLAQENPTNLLYQFLYASVLKKLKRGDQAIAQLLKQPRSEDYMPLHYTHHMLGDLYLYKGEYAKAISEYRQFLSLYKGENYIKSTYYQLYLASLLLGDKAAAERYLALVPEKGKLYLEEDKAAHEAARLQEQPHLALLKARLLSDGGYYTDALQTIVGFDVYRSKKPTDVLEFYYRKGRIYHSLNEKDLAKSNYLRTIEAAGKIPHYYAPNACLQLGYIYQSEGKTEQARDYFLQALSYPKHEYKNSIDSKAKVALSTLP